MIKVVLHHPQVPFYKMMDYIQMPHIYTHTTWHQDKAFFVFGNPFFLFHQYNLLLTIVKPSKTFVNAASWGRLCHCLPHKFVFLIFTYCIIIYSDYSINLVEVCISSNLSSHIYRYISQEHWIWHRHIWNWLHCLAVNYFK